MTERAAPPAGGCPSCGGSAGPRDRVCEVCGTQLAAASVRAGTPVDTSFPSRGSPRTAQEGLCEPCGLAALSGRDHQELDLGMLAGVTDRGVRHHRNEDAMALATAETADGPVALAVVCDGVSASARPDEASLGAAETAALVLLRAVRAGEDLEGASAEAVKSASAAVARLAGHAADAPSTTFISAVITSAAVTLCWLGDSRAYWLTPDAAAKRLTRDDSLAEEMVAAGLISEAEALASPHAHVVTRWVGGSLGEPTPHVTTFEPPGNGVLLLCSDGLWNYQPDAAELAAMALPAAFTDPLGAAAALVEFTLAAGGRDNVTVVLAPCPPGRRSPA